jgi:hypothetical protein
LKFFTQRRKNVKKKRFTQRHKGAKEGAQSGNYALLSAPLREIL